MLVLTYAYIFVKLDGLVKCFLIIKRNVWFSIYYHFTSKQMFITKWLLYWSFTIDFIDQNVIMIDDRPRSHQYTIVPPPYILKDGILIKLSIWNCFHKHAIWVKSHRTNRISYYLSYWFSLIECQMMKDWFRNQVSLKHECMH